MTEAMPFLQKYDITFLRPPTIEWGIFGRLELFLSQMGAPQSRDTLWGEEAQQSERDLTARQGEGYTACADEAAIAFS